MRSDLGEIAIVEQREPQRTSLDRLSFDLRGAERGDSFESLPAPGPRGCEEPAVAHNNHSIKSEARFEILHLATQRLGIGCFGREHAIRAVAE